MEVKILAKDNEQPGNKNLIGWLDANFDALVLNGLRFSFKIIEDGDAPKLVKEYGIDKLPAMILGKKTYCGNIEIQEALAPYIKKRISPGGPSTPEDDLRAFQMGEMSKAAIERDKGDPAEEDMSDKLKRRAEQDWKARQERFEEQRKARQQAPAPTESRRPDNIKVPIASGGGGSSSDIMQAVQSGSKDDALLARMFEET